MDYLVVGGHFTSRLGLRMGEGGGWILGWVGPVAQFRVRCGHLLQAPRLFPLCIHPLRFLEEGLILHAQFSIFSPLSSCCRFSTGDECVREQLCVCFKITNRKSRCTFLLHCCGSRKIAEHLFSSGCLLRFQVHRRGRNDRPSRDNRCSSDIEVSALLYWLIHLVFQSPNPLHSLPIPPVLPSLPRLPFTFYWIDSCASLPLSSLRMMYCRLNDRHFVVDAALFYPLKPLEMRRCPRKSLHLFHLN